MGKARFSKRADGYRSGLESGLGKQLTRQGVDFEYETLVVPFTQPAKDRRYTPDFFLPNAIVIETKGQFTSADRQKHLMVRDAWPELDIRFVFSRSSTRISKASKTTYAVWCNTKGFLYADRLVPLEWIREKPSQAALEALEALRNHRLNRRGK